MPTAFITGATGFIGGHMVRQLCAHGYRVRALVRPLSCYDGLKDLPVQIVQGDLSHISLLKNCMQGCDLVFHAAADYRLWTRKPAEMYAANVDGTRNILQAAWDLGVEKVVYTSTVGTIGLNESGTLADETSFLQLDSQTGHYKKSKFLAEQVALDFAKRGLPIVIVNPSAPVGSHDWKPTPTGKIVLDFLNGRMPMYLDTGLNLVDVEDVVEGHLLAARNGRIGERYILGHENLTLKQILILLSEMVGIPAPKIRCPYAFALTAAWFSEAATWILGGKEPRVPREGVYMARKYMFFSSKKAMEELGYTPGSTRVALSKAISWFLKNGYLTHPLPFHFQPMELETREGSSGMAMDDDAVVVAK